MRKFLLAFVVVLFAVAPAAFAQSSSDSPSLGDVARANRNTPKKPGVRTMTDDDVRKPEAPAADKRADDKADGANSAKPRKERVFNPDGEPTEEEDELVPEQPKKSEESAAKPEDKKTESDATADKDSKSEKQEDNKAELAREWKSKIAAQRQAVENLQRDIDVSDREHRLRASSYYSDAGLRLRNEQKWNEDERKYASDMEKKKQQLDKAKGQLQQLIDQARAAGFNNVD